MTPRDDALSFTGAPDDFDFLFGHWRVRHRRLKTRLAGDDRWEEFDGTSVCLPVMAGLGNVEDNLLELPAGRYRAVAMRAFDEEARQWSIWWMDARSQSIDPPVRGGFSGGVGTFIGDDLFDGAPIKVRFRWSDISADAAQWEQAFSPDGGKTWEVNWVMRFSRS